MDTNGRKCTPVNKTIKKIEFGIENILLTKENLYMWNTHKKWGLNASQKQIIYLNMEKGSADLELKNLLINLLNKKVHLFYLNIRPIEFN